MKRFFTIIILISTAIIAVNAQSNLYKIDDRLYDMYKEAEANVHNTEGLRLSKKMFDEAVKNGDKKSTVYRTCGTGKALRHRREKQKPV